MPSIGKAAHALGVPIHIYYTSNAPECWPFSAQYKANVAGLPFDERSVVLHTLSATKAGFEEQTGHWHYNVQSALQYQSLLKLPGYTLLKHLIFERVKTDDPDLTICGLPGAEQTAPPRRDNG
jgi:hypothetical protein